MLSYASIPRISTKETADDTWVTALEGWLEDSRDKSPLPILTIPLNQQVVDIYTYTYIYIYIYIYIHIFACM